MTIRLIAFDLDGTILRSDKSISDRTAEAVRKAAECGCLLVPATGRVIRAIPETVKSLAGLRCAVTANGASVVDLSNGSVLFSNLMTEQQTHWLLDRLCGYDYLVEAFCRGVSYSDRAKMDLLLSQSPPDDLVEMLRFSQTFVENLPEFVFSHRFRLEKINMPFLPAKLRRQLWKEIDSMEEYSVCSSCPGNIEINAASCSKGNALRQLCDKLGVPPEQVMAFGDGGNDRSMLEYAGLGVAMGNAEKPLLEVADCVTESNDRDGVARAIEKFVLS